MDFGTETDIRDYNSKLVISHDIPDAKSMGLDIFLDIYKSLNPSLPLALNIKSDGLQSELEKVLKNYQIEDYFVFDMAVPDGLIYARKGFRTFTRHSEHETSPAYYGLAHGVWMDEFNGHWISDAVINEHIRAEKSLCIVSPELHGRNHLQEWRHYKELESTIGKGKLMLCTDFPQLAREFFNDPN